MADLLSMALNFLSGTAKPGPYKTALPMLDELKFQNWVKQNKVPFDDGPKSDYDMRGFYKDMQSGKLATGLGPDGTIHYPDTYKTPYHKTFSNESIYATPNAPHWQGNSLFDKLGSLLVNEDPK